MRARQICICSSYDEGFSAIGNLTAQTLRAYASRFGFSVEIEPNIKMERHPAWHRVQFIPELLNRGYEYVLWLDADALIVRYDFDIRRVINGKSDLYLVQHDNPNHRPTLVPNTGVMLVRNSKWSVDLFHKLWNMTEYLDHCWWENGALIKLLGYTQLLDGSENQFNHDLLSHITFLPEIWNSVPCICSAPDPFIVHYAGYDLAARLRNIPTGVSKSLEAFHSSNGTRPSTWRWLTKNFERQ